MIPYKLSVIADVTEGKLYGKNHTVSNIFIDSRNAVNTNSLFFAIIGERHDGHLFLPELYAVGNRSFLVSTLPNDITTYQDASFILVDNTLAALQKFASYHLHKLTIPVVGITGSNGKTIVKEWIAQLLQDQIKIVRSPKSYNSQVGVPLSALLTDSNDKLAVFEAGISQKDEMDKLEEIIRPQIGILTTIGDAHQENFLNINEKLREKLKLFRHSEILIFSNNNALIELEIKALYENLTLFSWGFKPESDLKIQKIVRKFTNSVIFLDYKNTDFTITIPFIDSASIENVMCCVSLLLVLGYQPDFIADRVMQLTPIEMRLELKEGINNCTIINDSYNSDINSLTIALDFLRGLSQNERKTLILSDILQAGKDENELYGNVSKLIREKNVTRFIGIGTALSKNSHLFALENKEFYADTDVFLRNFTKNKFNDEAVLIKGSRNFKFERISHLIEKKVHETILEVNLSTLTDNLNYFRSLLKPGTRIMGMVKAFSYGSGSYEIARLLQFQRVDYLGVAFADEGVALREAGITMPIVVLNAEPGSFDTMINYQLEPEIYSYTSLCKFAGLVARKGRDNYPVHIKLDTGMHRLGFTENDCSMLMDYLKANKQVKVESIFSHLAASDEAIHTPFTLKQINLFDRLSSDIISNIGYPVLRHILNSAGIERFTEAQYDMVRLGIGLYGISANNAGLKNISTLRSSIVQIKEIAAGETVGYGRMGKVESPKRIGIVPIGYADGLNRKFGNGVGYFMVNGKPAYIIGNVCMDTCMIDITGIDANERDNVVIFGDKPNIKELAHSIGTIPYEILTSVSQRVKRIFVSD